MHTSNTAMKVEEAWNNPYWNIRRLGFSLFHNMFRFSLFFVPIWLLRNGLSLCETSGRRYPDVFFRQIYNRLLQQNFLGGSFVFAPNFKACFAVGRFADLSGVKADCCCCRYLCIFKVSGREKVKVCWSESDSCSSVKSDLRCTEDKYIPRTWYWWGKGKNL